MTIPSSPAIIVKKRVFIVDDHPIFRQGITQLINHEPDLMVCGSSESAPQALSSIEQARPDVMIVDISLQGGNGLELMKSLKTLHPSLPVLIVSMHDEALYAERALRAGARGYVMKGAPAENVTEALRKVLQGNVYLSQVMGALMLDGFIAGHALGGSMVESLSDRELEVFQFIGEGRGTRQIALDLGLSIKTVETHRSHIKRKLRLKTSPELMRAAVEWVTQEARLLQA